MPTILGRNYQLNEIHNLWTPYYSLIEQQAGNTTTLFNVGDQPNFGKVDAATGVGMRFNASGLAPTWTHESPLDEWDTPFDLTLASNWQQYAPILTSNGSGEQSDTPDAGGWSTAGAFSVWAWIYLNTAASNIIIAKWDETTGAQLREFHFGLDSNGDIGFTIYDEANNAAVGRKQEAALVTGRLYFVVGTFGGGTDAADVSVAVNGVLTDDADLIDDGGFANIVDTATVVSIGYLEGTGGAQEQLFDGKMLGAAWGVGYAQTELTAAQIANMWARGRLGVGI